MSLLALGSPSHPPYSLTQLTPSGPPAPSTFQPQQELHRGAGGSVTFPSPFSLQIFYFSQLKTKHLPLESAPPLATTPFLCSPSPPHFLSSHSLQAGFHRPHPTPPAMPLSTPPATSVVGQPEPASLLTCRGHTRHLPGTALVYVCRSSVISNSPAFPPQSVGLGNKLHSRPPSQPPLTAACSSSHTPVFPPPSRLLLLRLLGCPPRPGTF